MTTLGTLLGGFEPGWCRLSRRRPEGPSKPAVIVEGGETENMVADIKAVTAGTTAIVQTRNPVHPTMPDDPFDRLRCVPPTTTTRPCA